MGTKLTAKKDWGRNWQLVLKFGDEVDSKKNLGMKLTVGVKFGDEIDSNKNISQLRLKNKMQSVVNLSKEINQMIKLTKM